MFPYRNVMEWILEDQFDKVAPTFNCCTCPRCRNDIIAYALNKLPPKYVVSEMGEALSKTYILTNQHIVDIMSALSQGANVVRAQPRH